MASVAAVTRALFGKNALSQGRVAVANTGFGKFYSTGEFYSVNIKYINNNDL